MVIHKEDKWQNTIVKTADLEHAMTKIPDPLSVVYGDGTQTGAPVGKGTLHHCLTKIGIGFHEHTI